MILEKFRKKNHQIWSSYEGEIPIIKFNSRLKRKIWITHLFFITGLCYKNTIWTFYYPPSSQTKSWRAGRASVSHLCEPGSNPHYSMHLFFLRITISDTCINRAIPVIVTPEGVAQLVKVLRLLMLKATVRFPIASLFFLFFQIKAQMLVHKA